MSSTPNYPEHAKILIIGGGPAGSYCASCLQREGHQVVLLEAAKFPRYHVGESLLPSMRNYLRFIGLEEKFANHGFVQKPGATFKLDRDLRDTWTDFRAIGKGYGTWNVVRSEMDEMFLRHAQEQGVQVFEETTVKEIEWSGEDPKQSRPIAARYANKQGETGRITFDWLVDASGRNGVVQTKYLKNREYRESLRNVAVWGYWAGCKRHGKGTEKDGSGWFEALSDETGWAWVIPLHDGTTSIGVVMHITAANAKKATPKANGEKPTLTEHYLDQLQFVPGVRDIIGEEGYMVPGGAKSASDYSYYADTYSGDHFRLIGDAANFVDPFFSSGVHIGLTGGITAAATICSSMKGEITEELGQKWHDSKVGIAHTRFLFVVLSAYQQMHLQSVPATRDVDADNFDAAFEMFRPVIFGVSDSSTKLTDERVSSMMKNVQSYFDPTVDEENIVAVRKRYGPELTSIAGPVLSDAKIAEVAPDDEEAQRVLKKLQSAKTLARDIEATNLGKFPVLGYVANVERGKLGLKKAE